MKNTPEYQSWQAMKNRCGNPRAPKYRDYGARGIRVCDEWEASFEAFFAHVGKKPSKAHTLDRINNNGHYEPGNVRWATPQQQSVNKRNNRQITRNGSTHCLSEWCRLVGLNYHTVCGRLNRGYSVEDALTLAVSNSCKRTTARI